MAMRESLKVLQEAAELQTKKSNDYQNPNSRVQQADYYPRGLASILDIMHGKMLRCYSVLEAMENDPTYKPNFESINDSLVDLINYSSFGVAFMRGGIPGQDVTRDFLNRKIQTANNVVSVFSRPVEMTEGKPAYFWIGYPGGNG